MCKSCSKPGRNSPGVAGFPEEVTATGGGVVGGAEGVEFLPDETGVLGGHLDTEKRAWRVGGNGKCFCGAGTGRLEGQELPCDVSELPPTEDHKARVLQAHSLPHHLLSRIFNWDPPFQI